MLREGVQEAEAWIAVARAIQKLPERQRKKYEHLLTEREVARRVAGVLTQAQISLDRLGLSSRMYAAAAGTQASDHLAKAFPVPILRTSGYGHLAIHH